MKKADSMNVGKETEGTDYVTCPFPECTGRKFQTLGCHCTCIHHKTKEEVLKLYPRILWRSERYFEARSKFAKGKPVWNEGIRGYTCIHRRIQNIDWEYVKKLILEGKSAPQVAEIVVCSYPVIIKYIKKLYPKLCRKLKENGLRRKYEAIKGKHYTSHLKGKTYEEIFKSKEKADERKRKTSVWMKTDANIRKYCRHPSKPQIELFEKVKQKYPDAVLEYPIKLNTENTIWLDVAVFSLKLNYEFDGVYWHEVNQKNAKMTDNIRDKFLTELGWKVIRFTEGDEIVI